MIFSSPKLSAPRTSSIKAIGNTQKKVRRRWELYTFILPAALFLGIFTIYPVFTMATLSFEQVDLGGIISGITPFVGLHNYQQVLSDPVFQHSVVTSLIFTAASVIFQFIIGFLLALLFNQRFPLA